MVKSYLRYDESSTFGVVYSPGVDVHFDASENLVVCGALEAIHVWNAKQGVLVKQLRAPENKSMSGARVKAPPSVTRLARMHGSNKIIAGYTDGSIRVWDLDTNECLMTLNGHSRAVTSLRCNTDATLLASGSRDTDIIVWDLVAQTGRFRLRGHVDAVNDLCWFNDHLISASKDSLVKVWEIESQYCVQTLAGHRREVWSVDMCGNILVSGSFDAELRVWMLGTDTRFTLIGILRRHSTARVSLLRFSPCGSALAVQGQDKLLELFRVRSMERAKKKVARRLKRLREKHVQDKGEKDFLSSAVYSEAQSTQASDLFEELAPVITAQRQRSFCFGRKRIALGCIDNAISVYDVIMPAPDVKVNASLMVAKPVFTVDAEGHRSGVRAVTFSRDDTMIASTSRTHIKVWNVHSKKCIRTMRSGYGLCVHFLPGDQHVLVGTKSGRLELYSLASAELVQSIDAHNGAVWCIDIHPSGRGVVSGAADKQVKFWSFELTAITAVSHDAAADADAASRRKTLSLVHSRTLRLSDDVLCVQYSANGKFIAVSLLDHTIKLFHDDSLAFFLSLYGHRLPALCLALSSDNALIASGSADKSVRIWGFAFGDCHRALHAHDDSVMALQFIPQTHYLLSCSKDRNIRLWDADTFELVYTLPGHAAEVWSLAVSRYGQRFVSGSHDRSLRLWERSDEPVFIDEMQEESREAEFDGAVVDVAATPAPIGRRFDSGLASTVAESAAATEPASIESVEGGEMLMRAIDFVDIGRIQDNAVAQGAKKATSVNPELLGLSAPDYFVRSLKKLRPSELEVALLVLPFSYAKRSVLLLRELIHKGVAVERCVRCLLFLLQTHFEKFVSVSGAEAMSEMRCVRDCTRKRLRENKDEIGFNMAAMRYLKQELIDSSNANFFEARETLGNQSLVKTS